MLAILERLPADGELSLAELAAELRVSAATLRRDLAELEDQRLLRRTHGGVRTIDTPIEIPERLKDTQFKSAKQAIARRAAALIPTGRYVVALSGGTTTAEVGRVLAARRELTIVTNSLTAASQIAATPTLQVMMTGGFVRPHSFELVGPLAEATFGAVNIGTAVLGLDGISARGGATTHDETEARTNAAMVANASRVIVVADGSKVGRVTFARVGGLERVHELVTDTSADEDEVEAIRACGVLVHVVPPKE
jgi:DeoR family transcriptional regulator of aga operon